MTSNPAARCACAMTSASDRAVSPAVDGSSSQPPSMPRTTSMSRLSESGRASTKRCAIVDFPLAGGPFSNTSAAITSAYADVRGGDYVMRDLGRTRVVGRKRSTGFCVAKCAGPRPALCVGRRHRQPWPV